MTTSRRARLEEMLATNPEDAFLLYGLAMEIAREGNKDDAITKLRFLVVKHPDYHAGYHQLGQILMELGRHDEARQQLEQGVAAAQRNRNHHAVEEMSGLLMMLG